MKMYTYTFSFTQMMRSIKFSFYAIVFSLYLCSVILILVILVFFNFFDLDAFRTKVMNLLKNCCASSLRKLNAYVDYYQREIDKSILEFIRIWRADVCFQSLPFANVKGYQL